MFKDDPRAGMRHREESLAQEGQETFLGRQRYNTMAQMLTSERRLSRFISLARRGRESEQG